MSDPKQLVDKLWRYCHLLRDDGLSYQDYLEQLTFLLFLKMADELTKPPFSQASIIPEGLDWESLLTREGAELEAHYIHVLNELGHHPGMLGVIYRKGQNRVQDPAKLQRLIKDLIDAESWMTLEADVKGDAYEGLLERNASDLKSGAGQYFTPRALIKAMVEVTRPQPGMAICDPACGTGGFFLSAYQYIVANNTQLDPDQRAHLRSGAFTGWEIVDNTARLCAMNMLLHGLESPESDSPIHVDDALLADPGDRFDMILTNPPFGKKSAGPIERQDFWATTSNKQLNFLQHVKTLLKIGGTCAIVVPDNVLFEGGAGETVRRKLLHECDVHTLLRLPTGMFYAQGVKCNVMFFDRKPASEDPWTSAVWIYDLRTNQHFTLKTNPLGYEHLEDFVACFNVGDRTRRTETEQFKKFTFDDLMARDKASLDIFWLKDESLEDLENLPPPATLAAEIVEELEAILEEFSAIAEVLGGDDDQATP